MDSKARALKLGHSWIWNSWCNTLHEASWWRNQLFFFRRRNFWIRASKAEKLKNVFWQFFCWSRLVQVRIELNTERNARSPSIWQLNRWRCFQLEGELQCYRISQRTTQKMTQYFLKIAFSKIGISGIFRAWYQDAKRGKNLLLTLFCEWDRKFSVETFKFLKLLSLQKTYYLNTFRFHKYPCFWIFFAIEF